jgi:hypothetical protein
MSLKAVNRVMPDVSDYKQILKNVLDNRPSGTRQRLAEALRKNRSFVSQITNPAYPTPIPAQHLPRIFEVCHFSQKEKRDFLSAYEEVHPKRLNSMREPAPVRTISIEVPDFGNGDKNLEFEELLMSFARRVAHFAGGGKSDD